MFVDVDVDVDVAEENRNFEFELRSFIHLKSMCLFSHNWSFFCLFEFLNFI